MRVVDTLIDAEIAQLLALQGAARHHATDRRLKHALGKLRLPEPPVTYVPSRVAALGVQPLPIDQQHVLHVATLPPHHRDPFDRLLIAQAQIDDLTILTADPLFAAYDVATIAAA